MSHVITLIVLTLLIQLVTHILSMFYSELVTILCVLAVRPQYLSASYQSSSLSVTPYHFLLSILSLIITSISVPPNRFLYYWILLTFLLQFAVNYQVIFKYISTASNRNLPSLSHTRQFLGLASFSFDTVFPDFCQHFGPK